jgi:protein phosphatase
MSGQKPPNSIPPSSGEPLPSPDAVQQASGTIIITAEGITDQGRVRSNNEDSLGACDLSTRVTSAGPFDFKRSLGPRGMLFLVADGMGGQACGELASRMCCQLVPARLLEDSKTIETLRPAEFGAMLARALESANDSILEAARAQPACGGMGTTVTAAAILGSTLVVAQVGDSRAYLVREGRLVQLTRDQTFVSYLVEIGAVRPEDAASDPRRSILIQALGTAEKLKVVLTTAEVRRGDRLLMMSDGLYSMVPPEEILRIATAESDPGARCRRLVEEANLQGGADNVTVILAEFTGDGLASPDPAGTVGVEPLNSTT